MKQSSPQWELGIMANAHNYRKELLRRFEPFLGSTILEVGAGIGFFTELLALRPSTTHLSVIEPDPTCRAQLEQLDLPITIYEKTAQEILPAHPISSIVSSNVLEHIEDDTNEIATYFDLLAPGGHFCLFVPARQELYGPIDHAFGHFRRYTRPDLRQKLEQCGFLIKELHYFNLIGYAIWWLNFVVLKKTTFNPAMVKLHDQAIFPVTAAIERHLHAPVGQSLFAIAQKPE